MVKSRRGSIRPAQAGGREEKAIYGSAEIVRDIPIGPGLP